VLLITHNVAAGLVVRPTMIRQRLEQELPFLVTEAILMQGVQAGGDRQDLHERIRRHAVAAADRLKSEGGENDLATRIAADPAFPLDLDQIHAILTPERHIGRAPEQVDAFLEEAVAPVLDRFRVPETIPELRV
jgi:adenylosuccinate lyase